VLSVQQCKAILGPESNLDDQSTERLRDQMSALASVILETFPQARHHAESQGVSSSKGAASKPTHAHGLYVVEGKHA
jgi:hypothetical protein